MLILVVCSAAAILFQAAEAMDQQLSAVVVDVIMPEGLTPPEVLERIKAQGWKFMSCSHCQELGQQASRLLIGCTRVNNQSEARSAS